MTDSSICSHLPPPRNLADLLGLGHHRTLTRPLGRLLTACGIDERALCGTASDYDAFLALAAALPLCHDHPVADSVQQMLGSLTGMHAPLCPHTARAFWDAFTDLYWYQREISPETRLALSAETCPHCSVPTPSVWDGEEVYHLPAIDFSGNDPRAVPPADSRSPAENLSAWGETCLKELPADAACPILVTLPDDYRFFRPDPYHAALALCSLGSTDRSSAADRHLLLAQALRTVGGVLRDRHTPLFLRGGSASAVCDLIAYLHAADRLPETVWFPLDVTAAASVVGRYPHVSVGVLQNSSDTPNTMREKMALYAAIAPMGRAVLLKESNTPMTDLS